MEGLDTVPEKFTFMSLDDAHALESVLTKDSRVLIIGAGLIGLKCAEGIKERVKSITVVDLADRVLPSILDETGSAIVKDFLEKQGIEFHLGDTATKFAGTTATLKSGLTVDFDVLVIAVGVRPNTSLVKDAGGEVRRGIAADDTGKNDTARCLRRRRLRGELRYFRRRQPRTGAVAERLYAGQYRRHQYGGRQSEALTGRSR